MVACRTVEGMRVVSDSEVLVMFVTPDGEGTAKKYFGKAKKNGIKLGVGDGKIK
jgi:hypothetical protein